MKKRITLVVITISLIALLLVPTACVPKKDASPSKSTETEEFHSRITSLESKTASQAKQITALKNQESKDWQPAIDQLTSDLNKTNTKITEQETEIARLDATLKEALRIIEEEEETIATDETTRWKFTDERIIYPKSVPDSILVTVDDIDPRRIEEDGLYEVEVRIYNYGTTPWDMGSLELELTLKPDDYTPVNRSDTYLDSDSHPWLEWDTDFILKTREGEKVCRRIVFTSDRYNFSPTTLAPEQYYSLPLVLELFYD